MSIKRATKKDINTIFEIENQSFKFDGFSKRQFLYLIESNNSIFLVAKLNNKIIGYIILIKRKNCKKLRIYSIAVDVNYRNQNIGKSLLEKAEEIAKSNNFKELTLEVSEKNTLAYQFYLKNNFSIKGCKKEYYKDNSRAFIMKKDIVL